MSGVREQGGASMKPHPKLRKTIKWGGAAVTVLLMVVWIGSGWYYRTWNPGRGYLLVVGGGCFGVTKLPVALWGLTSVHLRFGNGTHPFYMEWWYRYSEATPAAEWQLLVPAWMLVVPSMMLSVSAWRLDTLARRARLNLCPKCNYDRAGLAKDAVCPECGSKGGASMTPHPKLRKTIKWGGAAVTVLLVVVWIGSGWWSITWNVRGGFAAFLADGQVGYGDWIRTPSWPWLHCMRLPACNLDLGTDYSFNLLVIVRSAIPLWLPAATATVVACAAWCADILAHRRERLARLNLCAKCRCDRTGFAKDAVCPECGCGGPERGVGP